MFGIGHLSLSNFFIYVYQITHSRVILDDSQDDSERLLWIIWFFIYPVTGVPIPLNNQCMLTYYSIDDSERLLLTQKVPFMTCPGSLAWQNCSTNEVYVVVCIAYLIFWIVYLAFWIVFLAFCIMFLAFGLVNLVFWIVYLAFCTAFLAFGLVLNLPWSRSLYPDVVAVKTLTNIWVGGGHNAENVQCSIINVQCSMFNC